MPCLLDSLCSAITGCLDKPEDIANEAGWAKKTAVTRPSEENCIRLQNPSLSSWSAGAWMVLWRLQTSLVSYPRFNYKCPAELL